eukprot:1154322-Pelagomonas_calceolata.AAC.10
MPSMPCAMQPVLHNVCAMSHAVNASSHLLSPTYFTRLPLPSHTCMLKTSSNWENTQGQLHLNWLLSSPTLVTRSLLPPPPACSQLFRPETHISRLLNHLNEPLHPRFFMPARTYFNDKATPSLPMPACFQLSRPGTHANKLFHHRFLTQAHTHFDDEAAPPSPRLRAASSRSLTTPIMTCIAQREGQTHKPACSDIPPVHSQRPLGLALHRGDRHHFCVL